MNPTEIEFAVRDLVARPFNGALFPFDLVGIYNASKVTISKLKSGLTNAADEPGDVLWKKRLFYRTAARGEDVGAIADSMANDPLVARHKPRFILVTDGVQLHARDLLADETLNTDYGRLDEGSDFLLPLAGYERRAEIEEHPADAKAAKKLKKLYDAILSANPTWTAGHHAHELNLLMTRLLFCFYAEDTGIFDEPQIFTKTLTNTEEDGSDVASMLERLFNVMNLAERPRSMSATEKRFPFVNGNLFEESVAIPQFSRTARRQMLECGSLDWTEINPDIFGSMIQTIAQDGTRSDLGMHYTSVPNILKVIQPLFLDELNEAYEKAKDSVPKLEALLGRLSKIRVFDPACGSGNFLVIAYKAMRKLEIDILKRVGEISPKAPFRLSGISLNHFFGIDVVDFACETAKLSLWIAEHQMNTVFREIFGDARPTLPLAKIDTVRCDNALIVDWHTICPRNDALETYVCGNPPYVGAKYQTHDQKKDVARIFAAVLKGDVKVDYISCWFVLLSNYISDSKRITGAFVATNSICQGEHVPFLWPYVFSRGLSIQFAHTSFKWSNSASHNAGVTCVIVGISNATDRPRALYTDDHKLTVSNINAYLVPSKANLIVVKSPEPINGLPEPREGDRPGDRGYLTLSPGERQTLLANHPEAAHLIRRFYSSEDLLHNIERYVLWMNDGDLPLANSIREIADRIRKVKEARSTSGARDGKRYAATPHRFEYARHQDIESLVIPVVSTERRQYLQIGFLQPMEIASNQLYVIYSPPAYLLALLSSRLHRIWAQTVGGKLEDRLRYSNGLIYNTFPVPALSDEQRLNLGDHSKNILRTRARHPGRTMAWLYNPETMPPNLTAAHAESDEYIERGIYGRAFRDDTQRLEHLFAMYGRLIANAPPPESLFSALDTKAV